MLMNVSPYRSCAGAKLFGSGTNCAVVHRCNDRSCEMFCDVTNGHQSPDHYLLVH